MRKLFIYLGGVNGSGKTTVARILDTEYSDFTVFYASKILLRYLGLVSHDDFKAFNDSPEKNRIDTYGKFYRSKLFKFSTPFGLVDAHYIIPKGKHEVQATVHDQWADKFDVFMHLVADPKEIIHRIQNKDADSKERKRQRITQYLDFDKNLEESVRSFQEQSVSFAKGVAKRSGKKFVLIRNDSRPELAAKKIHEKAMELLDKSSEN